VILAIAGILAAGPALCWDYPGHKASAEVAYSVLSAEERDRFATLLRSHPRYDEDFAAMMPAEITSGSRSDRARWLLWQAAYWPDIARGLPDPMRGNYHRGTWHYINSVVWLTDDDREALEGTLKHNVATNFEAPLRQGMNAVQALRGNLATWRDPAASDADRAVALCWVLHIAGDLHQPLHNTALFSRTLFPEGDRGGNLIEVRRGREARTLHYVWDSLLDEADDLRPSIHTRRVIDRLAVDDAAIDRWLLQHSNLARLSVYNGELAAQLIAAHRGGEPPVIRLSDEYLHRARSIARHQLIVAGHRMAALLR
jgi:hypothetical protein